MLAHKVHKILLDNKFSDASPSTMTQLAATMAISYQYLRDLLKRGMPKDIDRIAKGLGVNPAELN